VHMGLPFPMLECSTCCSRCASRHCVSRTALKPPVATVEVAGSPQPSGQACQGKQN
jgi:hypothetical protein